MKQEYISDKTLTGIAWSLLIRVCATWIPQDIKQDLKFRRMTIVQIFLR